MVAGASLVAVCRPGQGFGSDSGCEMCGPVSDVPLHAVRSVPGVPQASMDRQDSLGGDVP